MPRGLFQAISRAAGGTNLVAAGQARSNVIQSKGGLVARVAATLRYDAVALATDAPFFVADRAYTILSIVGRVEVAGADIGGVTGVVVKAASGTALTSGTALHSGSFNLKGAAATNQTLTLTNTILAAGDALALDLTGVSTAAVGAITVLLE